MEDAKYCCIISDCSSCNYPSKADSRDPYASPHNSSLQFSSRGLDLEFDSFSQGNAFDTSTFNKTKGFWRSGNFETSFWSHNSFSQGIKNSNVQNVIFIHSDKKSAAVVREAGLDIENQNPNIPNLHNNPSDTVFLSEGISENWVGESLRETQLKKWNEHRFTAQENNFINKHVNHANNAFRKNAGLNNELIIEEDAQSRVSNEEIQILPSGNDRKERSQFSDLLHQNSTQYDNNSLYTQARRSIRARSKNTLYKCLNQFLGNALQSAREQQQPDNIKTQEKAQPTLKFANSLEDLLTCKKSDIRDNSSILMNKFKDFQTAARPLDQTQNCKYSRRLWNSKRDHKILALVKKYGQNWNTIAEEIGHPFITAGMICNRYKHKLNPNVPKIKFSLQEDEEIAQCYKKHGPNWKLIAKYLPGRTERMVRDRFYSIVKKKGAAYLSVEESCSSLLEKHHEKLDDDEDYNAIDENLESILYHSGKKIKGKRRQINQEQLKESRANLFCTPKHRSHAMELEECNISKQLEGSPSVEEVRISEEREAAREYHEITSERSMSIFEINRENFNNSVQFPELQCISPQIESRLPREWQQYRLMSSLSKFGEERSLNMSPRFGRLGSCNAINKKRLSKENNFDNLIDFNQQPIEIVALSPSVKYLTRTEAFDHSTPNAVYLRSEEKELHRISCERSRINLNVCVEQGLRRTTLFTEIDPKVANRIDYLVNRMKSIQALYSRTLNEIEKLQDECGMTDSM